LLAIEETIKEQNSVLNATSYFAALLTTLEQQLIKQQQQHQRQQSSSEEENVIVSILYLLNIILKELPITILRNKYSAILMILTSSLEIEKIKNDSSVIRSVIGCLESLLLAQDIIVWQQIQTKKIFQSLLLISIDHRPKPR